MVGIDADDKGTDPTLTLEGVCDSVVSSRTLECYMGEIMKFLLWCVENKPNWLMADGTDHIAHIMEEHGEEGVHARRSRTCTELMGFNKVIKREIAVYPSLKDERYFDSFKRSLFIVAKSYECNEVLDPTYNPGREPEQQELFEVKQTFMFSVCNANLQTDMGKPIVRRHLGTTDSQ